MSDYQPMPFSQRLPEALITVFNLKEAVGRVGLSDLALLSLTFLAKWSVKPAYRQAGDHECLNPKVEFHGCSIMSLERQKESFLSERRLFQLRNLGSMVYGYGSICYIKKCTYVISRGIFS